MVHTEIKTDYCQNLVRDEDPDRYLACLFAPSFARDDIFALYAFNQELAKTKETTSEPTLGEIRLTWWQETLDGITAGHVREHPVAIAVSNIQRLPKIIPLLSQIIDARRLDIYADGPVDMQALITYVQRTGGDILQAACLLENEKATDSDLQNAQDIGAAFAMTGLIRASIWQAAANTHFLPQDQKKAASQSSGDTLTNISPILDQMLFRSKNWLTSVRTRAPKGKGHIFRIATITQRYITDLEKRGYADVSKAPLSPITPGVILKHIGFSLVSKY
ncbi:phytoene/squalene synthase family protein [Kordiimonas sediminis]|nr:squalene/phytoene synthase family protein [Kordiimonas sediminis]